jgi:peptidyl-prolyl cis-trans isomerase D
MFDFVDKHKRLIMVVLCVLIIPPFAFFGIDTYFRGGMGGQTVARVGDYEISQEEFSRALRERQQAIQRMMEGRRFDPALLDNPEMRFTILESMIQRRLLLEDALRLGLTVDDKKLKSIIGGIQAFHDEGTGFSLARYEQYLKSEGMTPVMFEARVRQDLLLQQFAYGYAESGFAPRTVVERLARISGQKREASYSVLAPDRFIGQVKLEADAARKFYDANSAEFRIPEQVRVEYVVLSPDTLAPGIQLNPAEVDAVYQQQVVTVAKARAEARAKAEKLLAELRKDPTRFEELAKQHSQDPGSAEKGGDLGFFGKGAMTGPFENAVFRLKENEISPLVSTEYGFHIIKLTGVRQVTGTKGKGEERRASHILISAPRESDLKGSRAQVELALKRQAAQKKVLEIADQFNNVVYEQADSLKPAAELINATPQVSGWITRERAAEPALNNPKLLAAIFSEEALKNKRNTEAIEVAPGTLVAARVVEYKPGSIRPFEQVRALLEKELAMRAAARLAVEEGQRRLDELRQGKSVQIAWSKPQLASRSDLKGLSEPVAQQAFRADVSKLPAYAGVEDPRGGYTLVRITRVEEVEKIPPETIEALANGLRQVLGQEALAAYVASLRQKTGVRISKEHLEKKDEGSPPPAPTQAPRKRGAF